MSNKVVNTLSVAVGAALLGAVMSANAATPFSINDLGQGYQVGDKAKEGKCGEGKCGASKGKKCMEMAAKTDQDKCMADAKAADAHCGADHKHKAGEAGCAAKAPEGHCGGDFKHKAGEAACAAKATEAHCGAEHKHKAGEAACAAKAGEKSCGGDKKGAEKSCSGDKKGAEKSCGEKH